MKTKLSALALSTLALGLLGCQSGRETVAPNTLTAVAAKADPNLNAGAADPVWASARRAKCRAMAGKRGVLCLLPAC